jgi:hypothetical protein
MNTDNVTTNMMTTNNLQHTNILQHTRRWGGQHAQTSHLVGKRKREA